MSAPSEAAGQWQWVLVREASSNTKAASIKLSTEQIFLVRENERTFHSSLPHVEKQVSVRVDRNGRVLLQQLGDKPSMLLRAGTGNCVRVTLRRNFATYLRRGDKLFLSCDSSIAFRCDRRSYAAGSGDDSSETLSSVAHATLKERPVHDENEGLKSLEKTDNPFLASFPSYSLPKHFPVHAGLWHEGLLYYIREPKRYQEITFWSNENVLVVYDKFPKARMHLLVVPFHCRLSRLSELSQLHLPLLREMDAVATNIGRSLSKDDETVRKFGFQYGFHALPSMKLLHLHIISRDFISDKLKNKKHWNSFTSKFFIPVQSVISTLERGGKFKLEPDNVYEKMLQQPLRCNRCCQEIANMPKLRRHIAECQALVAEPQGGKLFEEI